MHKLIVIFIYTRKDEITQINLDSLKKNNTDIQIIDICQHDFIDYHYRFLDDKPIKLWKPHEIWYWGSDNIFLYWYLSNPKIRAENYLILEWDTFANNQSIIEFFGESELINNTGIKTINYIKYKDNPFYHWFKEQRDNNFIRDIYTYDNFACCTPLCGTLINDNVVQAIISNIQEHKYANKFYVESKFATIANYLNFTTQEYSLNRKNFISYSENICNNYLNEIEKNNWSKNGIYHPVKKHTTIQRYFMSNQINISKLHKAMYGKIVDVKQSIEKLLSVNPNEKIQINNFLGGDPAPGVGKYLYLTYEKNGQIFEMTIPENGALDIKNL